MKLKSVLTLLAVVCFAVAKAQTADEIINKYFENTGGKAKWEALQGVKMTAKLKAQTMEFPMEVVQLKDGRTHSFFMVQGMKFNQNVFDGKTLWSTNQQTMKAEKSDAESTENYKMNEAKDFPDAFLDYQKKGYKIELVGKETIEGTETFKIKLTRKPTKVDGKEVENVSYYYFDAENYVPLVMESEVTSGPAKGMISQTKTSDYQEVNGLMFPFTIVQGAKGQPGGANIVFEKIELNPKVEASLFAFPASGN
ncbi:MAG: outer membrane lipoprotein-sorting protein [Bacteroidota bacterium]|jgi:hypothetical protein|nr:outer membrane lipoprotein-sorting protein [Cytophagales bacterium]MCE2957031.1 outer membrane lipoprotein-sorting protein [Flammeovirgaceae bacterium]MCZ8068888.1 outer membrane lipoprotein-sorting protein [Cytophagales bacterium]